MRADPKQVATFLFQYNCLPSGPMGPDATAKLIASERVAPPKAVEGGRVISKDDAPAPSNAAADRVTPRRKL